MDPATLSEDFDNPTTSMLAKIMFVADGVVQYVNTSDIKRFNPEDYDKKKAYKVCYKNDGHFYRAFVVGVGATEAEIEDGLSKTRFRMPNRLLQEIPEDDYSTGVEENQTTEQTNISKKKAHRKQNLQKKKDVAEQNFENLMLLGESWNKENIPDGDSSDKKLIRQLEEKLRIANQTIKQLETKIQQLTVENEKLRQMNLDWQQEVLDKWKDPAVPPLTPREEEGLKEIGFRKNDLVHLGNNVWISCSAYDSAVAKPKRKDYGMLIKELAVAVFGPSLKNCSVTGNASHRTKAPAKERLDPTKLMAIRDTVEYILKRKGEQLPRVAEICDSINQKIAEKIHDLNRGPRQKKNEEGERK